MAKTESGFEGADWIARNFRCEMSDLGRQVADLLGDVYEGIYHLADSALKKVDWANEYTVSVVLRTEMSTFDHNGLTRLVVLCHDRMLRCNIRARTVDYLEFRFHRRELREGGHFAQRCPTLENHVQIIRDYFKSEPVTPDKPPMIDIDYTPVLKAVERLYTEFCAGNDYEQAASAVVTAWDEMLG